MVQSQIRVRDLVRSEKIAEGEEILEPSILLLLGPLVPMRSSVDLPNCGSLLGQEDDWKTEKGEGDSVGGVKLCGGSVRAASAAPIIFARFWFCRWMLLAASPQFTVKLAPDGLFWFH